MKRLLVTLGAGAALALAAAPAYADQGPGDPFSTNCDTISNLADQGVGGAGVTNLAGASGGASGSSTDSQPAKLFPVHFVSTTDGGCTIDVNAH
jgi:hypothetical protein